MIEEIRKLENGKFQLVDAGDELFDIRKLRMAKLQIEMGLTQSEKNMAVARHNLAKINEALGKAPPEPASAPLEVPVPPALSPSDPSTMRAEHPADKYNGDGTLKDSAASDPPDPPGVPKQEKK